ncbi:MAG: ABC transporter ATP-binding protein [Anaerolineae bacterium]
MANEALRTTSDARTNGAVIWASELRKEFEDLVAVQDVDFEVQPGTIFGFIGPSGSGKTTTIRLLLGILEATSGDVRVLDEAPADFTQATQARIGYMPQHFALYPDLTIRENLGFAASIYGLGLRRRRNMAAVLDFVELSEHRKKSVRKISGGMKRRLSLAATLIHDPDLFFLDEPTAGIDPVLRQKFWERFRHLKGEGKTLFVTTQYVSEAAYCDQVAVLVEGSVLTVGTPEGLRHQAFGGDVVDMKTKQLLSSELIDDLQRLDFVTHAAHVGPDQAHVAVKEASVALPALVLWLEDRGIEIVSVEEHIPTFDEVFVTLIEKEDRS